LTIKGGQYLVKYQFINLIMKIIFDRFKEYFFWFDVPYLWLSIIENETNLSKWRPKTLKKIKEVRGARTFVWRQESVKAGHFKIVCMSLEAFHWLRWLKKVRLLSFFSGRYFLFLLVHINLYPSLVLLIWLIFWPESLSTCIKGQFRMM
jgi:hypothetical protein